MKQQGPKVKTQNHGFADLLIWILPAVHLSACVAISLGNLTTGWEQMIKVDFPISLLLVGLTWRLDHPLLWFGTLGTLWWWLLGFLIVSGGKTLLRGQTPD